MSFENMIAGMTYGTSNAFSNQILNQSNYINMLQNGGAGFGGGGNFGPQPYSGFGAGITPQLYQNTMNQINGFGSQAQPFSGAMRQLVQPQQMQMNQIQGLMQMLKQFFQAFPQLFNGLSPQSKQFVRQVIQQAPGLCACGGGKF
jgi:hypothetical protein